MNKFSMGMLTALLISVTTTPAHTADGKNIYKQSCSGCHGTEVFTRPDRKVKNLVELRNRVRQCSYAIESKWFDEEINAVTDYLNSAFYKF